MTPETPEKALRAFAKDMAAFQGECPVIKKTKTAKAGSFSYTYADLADVLAAVKPVLSKHGLALMQHVGGSDGQISVTTVLLHTGGHREESTVSIQAPMDLQKLGGALSYLKRYSVSAALAVSCEDDDDGAYASTSSRRAAPARRAPAPAAPAPAADGGEGISPSQITRVSIAAKKIGLSDSECKAMLLGRFGVDSRKKLTRVQASGLIKSLEEIASEGEESSRWDAINAAIAQGEGLLSQSNN